MNLLIVKRPTQSLLMDRLLMGVLMGVLMVGLSGCEKSEGVAESNQSIADVTQEVFDMQLTHEVEQAIAQEASLSEIDVLVLASAGVIRLTGTVENREEHDRLLSVARTVKGVERINDQIRVKW